MSKGIVVLGSTGSVGTQSLEVIRHMGFRVAALAAYGGRPELFESQVREFRPAVAAIYDPEAAKLLRSRLVGCGTEVLSGEEGVCEAARAPGAELVLSAIVGMRGLAPTLAAIECGRDVALANKESLVCAGALVTERAKRAGVRLLPVDSEHSAIFQCLEGCNNQNSIKKLWLTASGGPFWGMTAAETENMTLEQALRHPNWSMGQRLTVDSATLMNKGFELMEAMWLYGLPAEQIGILVHRESIVHSLVEFSDHAVLAQLSVPDMRLPIQYALTWPARCPSPTPALDLAAVGKLTFYPPDMKEFPCLRLALQAAKAGGNAGAVLAGADEEAVGLFLSQKVRFGAIARLVAHALETVPYGQADTQEAVCEADMAARAAVRRRAEFEI